MPTHSTSAPALQQLAVREVDEVLRLPEKRRPWRSTQSAVWPVAPFASSEKNMSKICLGEG
jgi:hypothetical protein